MLVAQITDLHVKQRGRMLPHMPHVIGPLRRTLAAIAGMRERPACILATGDLADRGSREEYQRLREILAATSIPVYLMPGNHDRRDIMRGVFTDHAYLGEPGRPAQFAIETAAMRVIALDSSEPPLRGGYLDALRLSWLTERLRERPYAPTILALHHPPFHTGVRDFDQQHFEGRDDLAKIVRANPQIRRIVAGHVHQPMRRVWNGTVAVTAPSTAPTIVRHPGRVGFALEAGGFLLHRVQSGEVTTTLVRTHSDAVALGA